MSDPQFIALYPYMAVYLQSSDRALILRKIDDLLTYLSDTTESAVEWFYIDEDGVAWYRTSYEYLRAKYFAWISIAQFKRHIYHLRDMRVLRIASGWSQYQFKKEVWLAIDREVLAQITITARGQSYQNDTTIVSKRYDPSIKMIRPSYQNDTIDVSKRYAESQDQNQESLPSEDSSSSSAPEARDLTAPEANRDENGNGAPLHEGEALTQKAAEYEESLAILTEWGINSPKREELAGIGLIRVRRWADYIASLPDSAIKLTRASYLVRMLESGQPAPAPKMSKADKWLNAKTWDEVEQ